MTARPFEVSHIMADAEVLQDRVRLSATLGGRGTTLQMSFLTSRDFRVVLIYINMTVVLDRRMGYGFNEK